MASSKAKDVSKLVEVGITQRRFYLQTLRYFFLWFLIIYVALVGFFSWREWQKPANDSYLRIITGLLNYVSQNEKYSWGDLMLGRKQPADIKQCLEYVKFYSKTWLIIASRKALWWEVVWVVVFSINLVVRDSRRVQKTPIIARAREEYPPGHLEKKGDHDKVVEPEGKEIVKAQEREERAVKTLFED